MTQQGTVAMELLFPSHKHHDYDEPIMNRPFLKFAYDGNLMSILPLNIREVLVMHIIAYVFGVKFVKDDLEALCNQHPQICEWNTQVTWAHSYDGGTGGARGLLMRIRGVATTMKDTLPYLKQTIKDKTQELDRNKQEVKDEIEAYTDHILMAPAGDTLLQTYSERRNEIIAADLKKLNTMRQSFEAVSEIYERVVEYADVVLKHTDALETMAVGYTNVMLKHATVFETMLEEDTKIHSAAVADLEAKKPHGQFQMSTTPIPQPIPPSSHTTFNVVRNNSFDSVILGPISGVNIRLVL